MSELTINTSQNVLINFKAASIGERIGASLLDLVIKAAYSIAVYYLFYYALNLNKLLNDSDSWTKGAAFLIIYSPILVYSLLLESIFEGQTIGKKILKSKVVKIDGYQASFGDYLIRWLFRILENNLFAAIGLLSMILNKKTQRLGDMAAGTAVITLKNSVTIDHTILEDIEDYYVPIYPLVIKLTDNDVRIIKETFQEARAKDDFETLHKLRLKIETVTGIKNQSGNTTDFIATVLKDYSFYTQKM